MSRRRPPTERFDRARLDEIRARVSLEAVIGRATKLKKHGHELTGLCPFHNEKTASFSVVPKKGFYHCFGCGAHGDVIGFVMRHEGLSFADAVERLAADSGSAVRTDKARPVAPPAPSLLEANAERRPWLERLWRETVPITPASPGDLYLRRRALEPLEASGAWPADLRLHPGLPHPHDKSLRFVAIVAAVRDRRGELVTVHRIFLEQREGRWDRLRGGLAPRCVAGSYRGAAIRLCPHGPVLGLAEGIETAMAAALLYGLPFWSTISCDNMAKVELPFDVGRVLLAQDRDIPKPEKGYPDGVGAAKVRLAARAIGASQRKVEIVRPTLPAPSDFDDVLMARRAAGLPLQLAV